MAEHVWSVLCDRSVIDKGTNQISLLNVIEGITFFVDKGDLEAQIDTMKNSGHRPALKHRMHLVTWWVRAQGDEPQSVEIRIVAISPQGERGAITAQGTINLLDFSSYRLQIEIGGIFYKGDGQYWLLIESKEQKTWKTVARLPLNIVVREIEGEEEKPAGVV